MQWSHMYYDKPEIALHTVTWQIGSHPNLVRTQLYLLLIVRIEDEPIQPSNRGPKIKS